MAIEISTEPNAISNSSTWTVASTVSANTNFRVGAELIVSGTTKATKYQPTGILSFDFTNVCRSLVSYDIIDYDTSSEEAPNGNSKLDYTVKFTEYWEATDGSLSTGANVTSNELIFLKAYTSDFDDYEIEINDTYKFLTTSPATKDIGLTEEDRLDFAIRKRYYEVTSWTNVNYSTFTASGASITSAIHSGSGNKLAKSNSIGTVYKGNAYFFVYSAVTLTLNSGQEPKIYLGDSIGSVKSNEITLSNGVNYDTIIPTETGAWLLWIYNTAPSNFSTNAFIIEWRNPSIDVYYLPYLLNGSADTGNATSLIADFPTYNRYIVPVNNNFFDSTHSKIEVSVRGGGPITISETKTFLIDQKCYKESFRVEWVGKLGAIEAYTFTLPRGEDYRVPKTYYKDENQREQVLESTPSTVYKLTSRYETQNTIDWLKTIQGSSKVWYYDGTNRNEVVCITTSQPVRKEGKRNQLSLQLKFNEDLSSTTDGGAL